jgi:Uncharacterised protein family (UPF0158)
MTDTSPAIDRRYRELLLQRSGAERVMMGGSMLATARALVVASIRAREPAVSATALRQALFLRFYGGDFRPAERQRIAAWLGRDDAASRGPTGRVPVNWDDLGMALTADPAAWSYYLDRRSGEVQMVPVDRLDDEGTWPSGDEIDAGLDAGHLIPVDPLGSSVEYGWMAEFAASVGNARLRDRLEAALGGRGAFRRFKNALLDAPDERTRWFAFRDARLREAAREWLAEQGIEPTASSPPEPS